MLISDQDLDASSTHQVITSSSLQYSTTITELRVEQSQVTPIFVEAAAMATRLTKSPVAILMVTGTSGCQISSISGLAKLGHLPTNPDLLLELAGLEYCFAQVMSSESKFSVADCQQHSELCHLPLVTVHGIQAYLGLPIITAAKDRLGTIAILDFKPRRFNNRDIEALQVISRLVASEFERKLLSQAQLDRSINNLHHGTVQGFDDPLAAAEYSQDRRSNSLLSVLSCRSCMVGEPDHTAPLTHTTRRKPARSRWRSLPVRVASPQGEGRCVAAPAIDPIDVDRTSADLTALQHNLGTSEHQSISGELLADLAQELRTPLTSILGMSRVLQQEIYGSLGSKQKDYLGIIYQSGQKLVEIVDRISTLSEDRLKE
jgi:His Kinase A (phospho-acceptor) domain/GAF domain